MKKQNILGVIKMAISRTLKELKKAMIKANISLNTALMITTYLQTEEQRREMINYLTQMKNIMTDHQAIQHIEKILNKKD